MLCDWNETPKLGPTNWLTKKSSQSIKQSQTLVTKMINNMSLTIGIKNWKPQNNSQKGFLILTWGLSGKYGPKILIELFEGIGFDPQKNYINFR